MQEQTEIIYRPNPDNNNHFFINREVEVSKLTSYSVQLHKIDGEVQGVSIHGRHKVCVLSVDFHSKQIFIHRYDYDTKIEELKDRMKRVFIMRTKSSIPCNLAFDEGLYDVFDIRPQKWVKEHKTASWFNRPEGNDEMGVKYTPKTVIAHAEPEVSEEVESLKGELQEMKNMLYTAMGKVDEAPLRKKVVTNLNPLRRVKKVKSMIEPQNEIEETIMEKLETMPNDGKWPKARIVEGHPDIILAKTPDNTPILGVDCAKKTPLYITSRAQAIRIRDNLNWIIDEGSEVMDATIRLRGGVSSSSQKETTEYLF